MELKTKKEYERVEMEIIEFDSNDVIVCSGGNETPIIIDPDD